MGEECMLIASPDVGRDSFGCDTYVQDCGPCEKCSPWAEGGGGAWNATRCVAVTGSKKPGEPCTAVGSGVSGEDDCERGAMCWDVGVDNMGTCSALCGGSAIEPVCAPGTFCAMSSGPINLCFFSCDPLIQNCPGDELCIPYDDGFLCAVDASGDMGGVNDPCEFANACDAGLVCVNTSGASSACMQGSQGCCQPFCEFVDGEDGECPNPDQVCVQWFDPMWESQPGYEDVGVCSIPG